MSNRASQREVVLGLLKSRPAVTNFELNQVCLRYAARIHELRKAGHEITGKRVGKSEWHFTYVGVQGVAA